MNIKIPHILTSFAAAMLMALPVIFTACDNDDCDDTPTRVYNALVTVCSSKSGTTLVINDTLTVKAANVASALYDKSEVRALVSLANTSPSNTIVDGQSVRLLTIDTIRTKPSTLWTETLDKQLGNAPVVIKDDWMTVAEDGYLTLRFNIMTGTKNVAHSLHLLKGRDPQKPYELELRHTDRGDYGSQYVEGVIAFDIKDILPVGTDKKVQLTVHYKDFAGKDRTAYISCSGLGKRHQPAPVPED